MSKSAHHYGVTVSDMETGLSFYRDTLGLSVGDRFDVESEAFSRFVGVDDADVELVFLEAAGCDIELIEYHNPPGGDANEGVANNDVGASHICLEVDDIQTLYDDLKDEVTFLSPPQTLDIGVTVVYMEDPDGNIVELIEE